MKVQRFLWLFVATAPCGNRLDWNSATTLCTREDQAGTWLFKVCWGPQLLVLWFPMKVRHFLWLFVVANTQTIWSQSLPQLSTSESQGIHSFFNVGNQIVSWLSMLATKVRLVSICIFCTWSACYGTPFGLNLYHKAQEGVTEPIAFIIVGNWIVSWSSGLATRVRLLSICAFGASTATPLNTVWSESLPLSTRGCDRTHCIHHCG